MLMFMLVVMMCMITMVVRMFVEFRWISVVQNA
jgi:hypothetical protein